MHLKAEYFSIKWKTIVKSDSYILRPGCFTWINVAFSQFILSFKSDIVFGKVGNAFIMFCHFSSKLFWYLCFNNANPKTHLQVFYTGHNLQYMSLPLSEKYYLITLSMAQQDDYTITYKTVYKFHLR